MVNKRENGRKMEKDGHIKRSSGYESGIKEKKGEKGRRLGTNGCANPID